MDQKSKSRVRESVPSEKSAGWIIARLFLLISVLQFAFGCQPASRLQNLPAQTLRLATAKDAGTFDPAVIVTQEWIPLAQIYETLVEWRPETGVVPKLAVGWERKDDLTWVFRLRENVKFQDGTAFDAAAAKYSLERFVRLRGSWQGLNLTAVNALAPHVLEIKTRESFLFLPDYLAYINFAVVSPAAVEKYGSKFAENPVGTGPFRLEAYRPQQEAVLRRFDDYWGEKPLLEAVVYRYLPDAQTRILALEAGEIDACRDLPPAEIARFRQSTRFAVQNGAGRHTHHIVFNRKWSRFREDFDDFRFRLAISLAANRRELVELALNGSGQPATAAVPPWFNLPSKNFPDEHDLARARELLAEMGWADADGDGTAEKNGRQLELRFVYSPTWSPQDSLMAEVFQAQLQKVGIRLILQPLETGAADSAERAGAADIRHRGITLAIGGIQYGLWSTYDSSNGSYKSVHYNNPVVDALLVEAKTARDQETANAAFARIVDILHDELPSVPLYYDEEIIVQNRRVAGGLLLTHPANYPLNLTGIYISE